MKKIAFPLLFILLVMFAVSANGQGKSYEFLLGGGIDPAVSPDSFSDGFNLGWTAKFAAGYFVTPQLAIGPNLSFNRFGLKKDSIAGTDQQNSDIKGGDMSILEFAGVGKYYLMPTDRTGNLYVLGGPGLAFSHSSDLKYRDTAGQSVTLNGEDDTDFMLTGGIGLKYNTSANWGLFVEGRYSHVFGKNDDISYLPIRAGVIF